MKRYIDFFRIKVILVIAIIVFPALFTVIFINSFTMADYGDFAAEITFKNAPENTAYVDILIKLPESSEEYVDFAEWESPPRKLVGYNEITKPELDFFNNPTGRSYTRKEPIYEDLSISPNSEIARLNADGYVSMSVHYASSRGFYYSNLYLDHLSEFADIMERYGKYKAAYVDENGNVLGITKTCRIRYNPKSANSFTTNGDKLVFSKSTIAPPLVVLICVSIFGEPLAIIALIICIALDYLQKPKPNLPPRPVCNPRSIEERSKDNGEQES